MRVYIFERISDGTSEIVQADDAEQAWVILKGRVGDISAYRLTGANG